MNDEGIRRLDFSRIGHCGYESELNQMEALFLQAVSNEEVASAAHMPTGVIVEAESGAGKSALLDQFSSRREPFVVRGKFEEGATAASEPFAALNEAVEQLVQKLADEKEFWSKELAPIVNKDIEILVSVFPCLESILDTTSDDASLSAFVAASAAAASFGDKKQPKNEEPRVRDSHRSSTRSMDMINFEAFGNMTDQEWRFERFRLSFRDLIRCVSSHRLIVMVMDDMHWAEADSLAVLKTLIIDRTPDRKFFFVGASRPFKESELLRSFLHGVPKSKVATLCLTYLRLDDILVLLARLLGDQISSENIDDLEPFAKIVQRKSSGNPFVMLQYLRALEQKNLIFFSERNSRWEWDTEGISREHATLENPAELVAENLNAVDSQTRAALTVAAAFGASRFASSTIVHAIPILEQKESGQDMMEYEEIDPSTLRTSLRTIQGPLHVAVQKGFLEELSGGHFKFSHDRIRHAAYSLLPQGNARKALHVRIGRQLRSWMDQESELGLSGLSEESMLLHATKQLNAGAELISDQWELLDLAELNFQAAELAAKKSSFIQSMESLGMGLKHLGENPWERHYSITLKLSVASARIQYSSGLYEKSMATSNEVIKCAKSFTDKRPVYHTKFLCLCHQKRYPDAGALLLDIFDMLQEPFPRRIVANRMTREYRNIDRQMKSISDEELLSFDTRDESHYRVFCEFIDRLLDVNFWVSGHPWLFYAGMGILRMTKFMLERKASPVLPFAVVHWSILKIRFQDLADGFRYGKLSLVLAKRTRHVHTDLSLRTEIAYWSSVHHWQRSPREGLKPMKVCLDNLWICGGLEYFHTEQCQLLRLSFLCGEHLDVVAKDCKAHSESLLDFQHMVQWQAHAPLCQAVQNLRAQSMSKPAVLSGDFMDEDSFLEGKPKDTSQEMIQYQFFGLIVAYHFGDYEKALSLVSKECTEDKNVFLGGPYHLVQVRMLYLGIVHFALARETQKHKYRRLGRSCMAQLEAWMKKGSIVCRYMHRLLIAEEKSLTTTARIRNASLLKPVTDAYDQAIDEAQKLHMIHHVALGNELAGSFLMERSSSSSSSSSEPSSGRTAAQSYLRKAVAAYREWGALGKVQELESRFGALLKRDDDDGVAIP